MYSTLEFLLERDDELPSNTLQYTRGWQPMASRAFGSFFAASGMPREKEKIVTSRRIIACCQVGPYSPHYLSTILNFFVN